MIKWIESTPTNQLVDKTATSVETTVSSDLQLTGKTLQAIRGFGGCFNELGYLPLTKLDEAQQQDIYHDLFSPDELNFTFNRTPVGANDFAATWYSYDETDGDYNLNEFSIDRSSYYGCLFFKGAITRIDVFWCPAHCCCRYDRSVTKWYQREKKSLAE